MSRGGSVADLSTPRWRSRLSRMAALRNRLAHGYAAVDMERIWTELPAGLDEPDHFVAAIAEHLGKA